MIEQVNRSMVRQVQVQGDDGGVLYNEIVHAPSQEGGSPSFRALRVSSSSCSACSLWQLHLGNFPRECSTFFDMQQEKMEDA